MSNSKLTKEQKAERKEMLTTLKAEGLPAAFAQYGGVTVLLVQTGLGNAKLSTSVCSPDEKKVRRKVGEYHALVRYLNGESQPVPVFPEEGYSLKDSAEYIAAKLGDWPIY